MTLNSARMRYFLTVTFLLVCYVHGKNIISPLHDVDIVPFEKATFAMGCFWSCEPVFGAQKGVLRTRVGYTGGTIENPTYRNLGDHTETVEIDYDPNTITYRQLLDLFWKSNESGQTNRVKRQYASIIFYHSEEQRKIAEESLIAAQKIRSNETIITEIVKSGTFYPAEDYHQKYVLQCHEGLVKQLGLNSKLLQTSHVAAKLNSYLAGVGGEKQFLEEAQHLGLNKKQTDYVLQYLRKNENIFSC